MKKGFLIFAAMLLMLITAVSASAEEFTEGMLIYTVENGEATVTGYTMETLQDLEIPSELGGYPVTAIGNEAFSLCQSIKKVVIPDTVRVIGNGAFGHCYKLEEVVIGNGTERIGERAFFWCDSLKSFIIPDSVVEVGKECLYNCDALEEVVIGNGITDLTGLSIPRYVSKVVLGEGITEIPAGYFSMKGNIDIQVKGRLTKIGDNAFRYSSVKYFEIPDTVEEIGSEAFCDVAAVNGLPRSLKKVGDKAFADCDLNGSELPPELEYIGAGAFNSSKGLENFVFHDKITYIGSGAFYNSSLRGTLNMINEEFIGSMAFCDCKGIDKVVIGENVKRVESSAFRDLKLDELLVLCGDGVLESNSFYVSSYKKLEIGDNMTDDCGLVWNATETVILGKGIKHLRGFRQKYVEVRADLERLPANTFYYETDVVEVHFTGNVKEIEASVFVGCRNLETVEIRGDYTQLPDNFFSGLSALKKVILDGNLTEIGKKAFNKCVTLEEIELTGPITVIGEEAFNNCTSLRAVKLPGSVKEIGKRAFSGCSALTDMSDVFENLTRLGEEAFMDSGITKAYIPESVTSMGKGVFRNCAELSEASIAAERLGEEAFADSGLKKVQLADTVVSIGKGAFKNCVLLTEITLPKKLSEIREESFEGCSSLTAIVVPDMVESIGKAAFKDCVSLTEVKLPRDLRHVENELFSGCESLTSVNLPITVSTIGTSAFEGCVSLTSMTMPLDLTHIYSHAFEGCRGLTRVNFNNTEYIAAYAFAGCTGLKLLDIPDTVSYIGEYAFTLCTSLTEVYLPTDLRQLNFGLFMACTSLKDITIPDTVEVICTYAFFGCLSLEEINIPTSLLWGNDYYAGAFMYTPSLKRFNVSKKNPYFQEVNGILFAENRTVIVEYPGGKEAEAYEIPSTVRTIFGTAFAYAPVHKLTIPKTVERISTSAFIGSGLSAYVYKDTVGEMAMEILGDVDYFVIDGEHKGLYFNNMDVGDYTAMISLINDNDKAFSGEDLYIAMYSGNRLVDTVLLKGSEYTIPARDKIRFIVNGLGEDVDYVKVFLWDENMAPVLKPEGMRHTSSYSVQEGVQLQSAAEYVTAF